MKRFVSLAVISTLAVCSLFAQKTWNLDKSHATIGFTVTHMLVSEVPGSFKDFDIDFASSKEDFTDATVTATITAASIDTDNERRDGHLKGKDFFDVEKYPQITFVSTEFEKTDDKTYTIHGNLTIRDVTKLVAFDAKLIGVLTTPRGTISGWKASLTVNRFDYNLKWDRALETGALVVSEDVTITLNAEFIQPAKTNG